jgi:hypothetical protein
LRARGLYHASKTLMQEPTRPEAGGMVKIEFHAAKNASNFGIIQRVTFPNGKVLRAYLDRRELRFITFLFASPEFGFEDE